ncbi:helix-turn-helix domain-containing protein [Corynebacterium accolens]|uniref:helix-turn-helix domain-containing protein n=1 Tax=Corynebacterium accolens TaxID=38284 RepID=UPI0032B2339F
MKRTDELTTQQAADFLNVSRPRVIELMDEGTLKGAYRRCLPPSVCPQRAGL